MSKPITKSLEIETDQNNKYKLDFTIETDSVTIQVDNPIKEKNYPLFFCKRTVYDLKNDFRPLFNDCYNVQQEWKIIDESIEKKNYSVYEHFDHLVIDFPVKNNEFFVKFYLQKAHEPTVSERHPNSSFWYYYFLNTNPNYSANLKDKKGYSAYKLNDGRFAIGCDTEVIVYDPENIIPVVTINDEVGSCINCFCQLPNGKLCFGTNKGKINFCDILQEDYTLTQTINLPSSVNGIEFLSFGNLCVICEDKTLKYFYEENGEYKESMSINLEHIPSKMMQYKDKIMIIVCKDNAIIFIDFIEKQILKTITDAKCERSLVQLTDITMAVSSKDIIEVYDIVKMIKVREFKVNGDIKVFCKLTDDIILSGDDKGTITQWKLHGINFNEVCKKEKAHNDCIEDIITLNNGAVVTVGLDSIVKVWV